MNEFLTFSNAIQFAFLILGWSIRQQLEFIKVNIDEAKKSANQAHERIDTILNK